MAKLFFILFLLGISLLTHAQDVAKVTYTCLAREIEEQATPSQRDWILEISGDSSFCYREKDALEIKYNFDYEDKVLKNFSDESLTYLGYINGVKYCTTERMPDFQWEYLDEDSLICGYSCQKARASFRGRTWNVWYTVDLPYNDGPWKLCGLPGLILSAIDERGDYYYSAYKMEKKDKISCDFSTKGCKTVTPRRFSEISRDSWEDDERMKGKIYIDGKEWKPEKKSPCPLEYFDDNKKT